MCSPWLAWIQELNECYLHRCSSRDARTVSCTKLAFASFCVFQVAGCHAAPVGFSPSLSWQQQQVCNFSDMRQVQQKCPSLLLQQPKRNKTKKKILFCRCSAFGFQRIMKNRTHWRNTTLDDNVTMVRTWLRTGCINRNRIES